MRHIGIVRTWTVPLALPAECGRCNSGDGYLGCFAV
jgi:hypothetical protein